MNKTTYTRKIREDNTSGINGVFWRESRKRWAVEIKVFDKKIWLGQFIQKKDAEQMRKDADYYFNFLRNL